MKKKTAVTAAVLIIAVALCSLAVSATDPPPKTGGVYSLSCEDGYTVSVLDGNSAASRYSAGELNGTALIAPISIYDGADGFTMSFYGVAETEYVIFDVATEGLESDAMVTLSSDNLKYINQQSGAGASLSFDVKPSQMTAGRHTLYVSSTYGEFTKIASYKVASTWVESEYILGDVNGDGDVSSLDAAFVLRYSAGLEELTETQIRAARVTYSGEYSPSSLDAANILRYAAGLDKRFPVELLNQG